MAHDHVLEEVDGFDIETNFSIYDLDVETGEYHVIRKGSQDQSS